MKSLAGSGCGTSWTCINSRLMNFCNACGSRIFLALWIGSSKNRSYKTNESCIIEILSGIKATCTVSQQDIATSFVL